MIRRLWLLGLVPVMLVFPVLLAGATPDLLQASPSPVPMTPTPTWTPPPVTPTWEPEDIPRVSIEYGEEIADTFPPGLTTTLFSFEGRAGDSVSVRLTLEEEPLAAYLGLSKDLEAVYGIYPVTRSGKVHYLNGILPESGRYDLTLSDQSRPSSTAPFRYTLSLSLLEAQPVTLGERIGGEMTLEKPADVYTFRAEAGDIIVLRVDAPAVFRPSLSFTEDPPADRPQHHIQNLPYQVTAYGGTIEIGPVTINKSGDYLALIQKGFESDYQIQAVVDDVQPEGAYTFQVERIEPATISYGDEVEGAITVGEEADYYRLEVEYGDIIDIHAVSAIDTTLSLHDENGVVLVHNDDGGGGNNPAIQRFAIPALEPKPYFVRIAPFLLGETLAYTLKLDLNPFSRLDASPQRVYLAKRWPAGEQLTFHAEAGEQVRLVMVMVRGAITPNVSITQAGQTLLDIQQTEQERLAVDFTVPESGPVMIKMYHSLAVLDVWLEPLEAEEDEDMSADFQHLW